MLLKNNLPFVCLALIAIFGVLAMTEGKEGKEGKGGKGGGKWGKNMTCNGEAMPEGANLQGKKDSWKKCAKEIMGAGKGQGSTTPSAEGAEAEEGEGNKGKGKGGKGGRKPNMCMKVCIWKSDKILGDDGKYNADGTEALIKANFPASVTADIKKGVDACASTHGASFNMDNNCEGYQKFAMCQMKTYMDVCKWAGKGKGKKGGKGGTTEATE